MKPVVLLIEDDNYIANVLKTLLTTNGYTVIAATTAATALSLAASHVPDITLLDLGLPDMDGLSVLTQLRTWTSSPVIVVSARSREREKVTALDNGADDYIVKPFSAQELLARMRANLRHLSTSTIDEEKNYSIGDLAVEFSKDRVMLKGEDIHLTRIEYRIVKLLAQQPGRVLTYDYIISSIWGPYAPTQDNLILRVNMANIRRKLEKNHATPKYILTEIGIGYRMADFE